MAVTGIGISDDHLLKILGFRLIPVAAGGHLGSKIANTTPYLNQTFTKILAATHVRSHTRLKFTSMQCDVR